MRNQYHAVVLCAIIVRYNPSCHIQQRASTGPFPILPTAPYRLCASPRLHLPIAGIEARRQRYTTTLTFLILCAPSASNMQHAPLTISNRLSNTIHQTDSLELFITAPSRTPTDSAHPRHTLPRNLYTTTSWNGHNKAKLHYRIRTVRNDVDLHHIVVHVCNDVRLLHPAVLSAATLN